MESEARGQENRSCEPVPSLGFGYLSGFQLGEYSGVQSPESVCIWLKKVMVVIFWKASEDNYSANHVVHI